MSRSLARSRVLVAVLLVGAGGLALVPGQAGGKVWDKEITNSIAMKLVRIPPGTFKMGSDEYVDEKPVHEVKISKEFWIGIHEVTQGQFQKVMGYNPSYFSKDGKGGEGLKYEFSKPAGGKDEVPADTSAFPVENVSWEEAKEFCEKLSKLAEEKRRGRTYRLPTEAEWEYSCRAGTKTAFHFGDSLSSKQANFNGNEGRTTPVGYYKEKNAFGLFDMHGNVWEWCSDWYAKDYYDKSDKKDPKGPKTGESRVLRGGSWYGSACDCRAAIRNVNQPGNRYGVIGFRVVCVRARTR